MPPPREHDTREGAHTHSTLFRTRSLSPRNRHFGETPLHHSGSRPTTRHPATDIENANTTRAELAEAHRLLTLGLVVEADVVEAAVRAAPPPAPRCPHLAGSVPPPLSSDHHQHRALRVRDDDDKKHHQEDEHEPHGDEKHHRKLRPPPPCDDYDAFLIFPYSIGHT